MTLPVRKKKKKKKAGNGVFPGATESESQWSPRNGMSGVQAAQI